MLRSGRGDGDDPHPSASYRPTGMARDLGAAADMSENKQEGGNDSLSCHICCDDFDRPKILSCGHTFCMQCIDKVVDRADAPTLQCPICRRAVAFPDSGKTEDLTTNFQLLSMIDHAKNQRTTHEDGRKNICKIHGEKRKLYCQTCEEPICVNCTLKEHEVGKHTITTRNESVADLQKEVDRLARQLPAVRESFNDMRNRFEERKTSYDQDENDLREAVQKALQEKQMELAEHAANVILEIERSLNESNTENEKFGEEISRLEGILEKAERNAGNARESLGNCDFVEKEEVAEITRDLANVGNEIGNLTRVLQMLPSKTQLVFRASANKERVGKLRHIFYLGPTLKRVLAVALLLVCAFVSWGVWG